MHSGPVRTGATVLAVLVGAAVLSGCSSPAEKHRPQVPARVCWGAFTASEVEPFLPDGDEARDDTGYPFRLYRSRTSVSCVINVDGNTHFTATADRGLPIEWSTWEKAGGTPFVVGKRGLIWNSGTVTYFVCERPDSSDEIQLHLSGEIPGDAAKTRRVLAELTKKYVTFAQKELGCQP